MQFKLIAKTMALAVVLCELVFARSGQEWYDYVQSHHKARTEKITRDMGAIIGDLNTYMLHVGMNQLRSLPPENGIYESILKYIENDFSVQKWHEKTYEEDPSWYHVPPLASLKEKLRFFNEQVLGQGVHNDLPLIKHTLLNDGSVHREAAPRDLTLTSFTGATRQYHCEKFLDMLAVYQKLNQERFGLLFLQNMKNVEKLLDFLQRYSTETIGDEAIEAFLLGDEGMMNSAFVGKDNIILKDAQALIKDRTDYQKEIERREFYVQNQEELQGFWKNRGQASDAPQKTKKFQNHWHKKRWHKKHWHKKHWEKRKLKRAERINGKKLRKRRIQRQSQKNEGRGFS